MLIFKRAIWEEKLIHLEENEKETVCRIQREPNTLLHYNKLP